MIDYVGLPITEALKEVVAARERYGLEQRVRIVASAKLVTPDKVAWALCMGADFVSSAKTSKVHYETNFRCSSTDLLSV